MSNKTKKTLFTLALGVVIFLVFLLPIIRPTDKSKPNSGSGSSDVSTVSQASGDTAAFVQPDPYAAYGDRAREDADENPLMPNFAYQTLNGESVEFVQSEGKVRIIMFWATWCSVCKSDMPTINEIANTYKDDVVLIPLAAVDGARETVDTVKAYAAQSSYNNLDFCIDVDSTVAKAAAIPGFPTFLIVDAQGYIIDIHIGALRATDADAYIAAAK